MSKSPFAKEEAKTYTYPEPLNRPKEKDELDAIYEARVERVDPEEEAAGHWVRFRVPRSRADVDAVADLTQSIVTVGSDNNGDGAKLEQRISRGNRGVFELLVEEWSFDAPCTGSNYDRLDMWAGDWIIACLADVSQRGSKRDYVKKAASSSTEPSGSPSSSAQEATS